MTISSCSRAQLASLTPSLMLHRYHLGRRSFSARCVPLQPPDLPHLAETARISLTPKEVEEFAPKIRQVIDWFGQLQAVNLESIEPALGPDTGVGDNFREDVQEIFEQREAMLGGVPSYDEPYIKVPKVLNKM